MNKSKWAVFLILLSLSLAIIFFNQNRPVLLFKNYLNKLLSPLEIIFSKAGNKFLFWQNAFFNIKNIKNLNTKLITENLELYGKVAKLSQLEEENILLKEKLNLADKSFLDTKLAKIIGRDFENNRSFLIDKGSNDGIAIGMPAIIAGKIIVGKVIDVNYNTSKVRTVLDIQNKIAVVTLNGGISGLARGLGSDLIFDLIAKNNKPETGDIIISSGTDGLWPRGLIIGKIKTVRLEDNQVFNTADIDLLTDFWKFNDIFVITNFKSEKNEK